MYTHCLYVITYPLSTRRETFIHDLHAVNSFSSWSSNEHLTVIYWDYLLQQQREYSGFVTGALTNDKLVHPYFVHLRHLIFHTDEVFNSDLFYLSHLCTHVCKCTVTTKYLLGQNNLRN